MQRMIRHIYSIFFTLCLPFILIRLWWKGRHLPAYRRGIAGRLGCDRTLATCDIWIHAVSLGEVNAVSPLITALLKQNFKLLVTTATPTGAAQLTRRFQHTVLHQYLPYDIPLIMKRFYHQRKPRLAIIMETELWPNLVHLAKNSNIPLLLINARLSEKSYRGYRFLKFFLKKTLRQFEGILTQHEDDAKRYKALGALPKQIAVYGNLKYDLTIPTEVSQIAHYIQSRIDVNRPIIMLASTHDSEESLILPFFKQLKTALTPSPLLLIAPRHPERFKGVFQLCQEEGFSVACRNQPADISNHNDIIVLDSLGELMDFYQISNCVIMGGSFVPVGGHNVLEPIALNIPVICGPYLFNFKSIASKLKEEKGIIIIETVEEIIEQVIRLLKDAAFREELIANAYRVFKQNQGATQRYLDKINQSIKSI